MTIVKKPKDSLKTRLNFRVPDTIKNDLLEIDSEYSKPIREAILQYIPIKKLMLNPLALPRAIGNNGSEIIFSVGEDGRFQISSNGEIIPIDHDDLIIFMANVYLFTLNKIKA